MSNKIKNIPTNNWDKWYGASAYLLWIVIWIVYHQYNMADRDLLKVYRDINEVVEFSTQVDGSALAWLIIIIGLPLAGLSILIRRTLMGKSWSGLLIFFIFAGLTYIFWSFIPEMPHYNYSESFSRGDVAGFVSTGFAPLFALAPLYLIAACLFICPLFMGTKFSRELYKTATKNVIGAALASIVLFELDFLTKTSASGFFFCSWFVIYFYFIFIWGKGLNNLRKLKTLNQMNNESAQKKWNAAYYKNLGLTAESSLSKNEREKLAVKQTNEEFGILSASKGKFSEKPKAFFSKAKSFLTQLMKTNVKDIDP